MNKEEIEKAKIGLWNIRADCLKIIQCGLSDRQDREECLKEIDVVDDIFKYIKELEQKSEKLDKVTDKLKEPITDKNIDIIASKLFKIVYKDIINLTKDKIINFANEYRKDLLEIIEGEKE